MTRKEALKDLLAIVEAGNDRADIYNFAAAALPPQSAYSRCAFHDAAKAYNGSWDAAKALHDALLTAVSQYSIVTDPTCCKVSVCWWPDGLSGEREIHAHAYGECGEEARTWFVAILKALIAQEEEA